tara:strand:- start:11686 stop:12075 length:390 start_codon:yes stop_codon:yes gene_type:complete
MSKDVQYLNLDEIDPSIKKVLTIKGVQYEFKQPTVGEFVQEMKTVRALADKFKEDKNASEFDMIEAMVKSQARSVSNAFPEIPEDIIDGLTHPQLNIIRKFIENQFEEENKEAQDELGNVQAAERKSKQ